MDSAADLETTGGFLSGYWPPPPTCWNHMYHVTLYVLVLLYFLAEIVFYGYYRWLIRQTQHIHSEPVPFPKGRKKFIQNMLQAVEDVLPSRDRKHALRVFFSNWFYGAPFERLRRGNIEDFVSRNMWGKLPQQLDPADKEEFDSYIAFIEQTFGDGFAFPPGKDATLKVMCNHLDQVDSIYHPLVFYFATYLVHKIGAMILRAWGFRKQYSGGLKYWYRPASSPDQKSKTPTVFLHGIGLGYVLYLGLILRIKREMFLVEMPWVTMRLFERIPSAKRFALDVEMMLARHCVEQVCYISHSYGSFATAWIQNYAPLTVESMILLDPPCLVLALPDVCANFLHLRKGLRTHIQSSFKVLSHPTSTFEWVRRQISRVLRLVILYAFAREISISESLTRSFWWYESCLFAEDLPETTTVLLSGDDMIVPVDEIHSYLQLAAERLPSRDFKIIWMERLSHGACLVHPGAINQILNRLETSH